MDKYMDKYLEELNNLTNENIVYVDKRYWNEIETALKALKIVKKKRINLEYLKCCESYEQYKTICSYWEEITQKEFDLLKDVLL